METMLPKRFAQLEEMLTLSSPSGDECVIADWLTAHVAANIPGATIRRLGDSVVCTRSPQPRVAVFAHTDTTGFTLGYGGALIPIGSPAHRETEILRSVSDGEEHVAKKLKSGEWGVAGRGKNLKPGDRFVYAEPHALNDGSLTGPYLDNRCGVWAALQVLEACPQAAVAFTAGEEHSGGGAAVCARYVYETLEIDCAIVSDITWHTASVRCGRGPAISLRDQWIPAQRYLRKVLAIAQNSNIPYQIEVESGGGSDGASIEKSSFPIDWVFVGAPEKRAHEANEEIDLKDLQHMAELIVALVNGLAGSD